VTLPAVPAHDALQLAAVVSPYLVPVVASTITKHEVEVAIRAAENCVAVDATLMEPPPTPLAHGTVPFAAEAVAPAT
jgi:hypothetical protein